MNRLTIVARANTHTGYGEMLLNIFAGLEDRGIFCAIRPINIQEPFGTMFPLELKSRFVSGPQPEPWELLIHGPEMLPTPGKRTIYFTMFENTALPTNYVGFMNRCECVVVPSQWVARNFKASGVQVPIEVVPLGYAPGIFTPQEPRPDDLCVFGVAGRTQHGPIRKGVGAAIEIFQKAFPPEVFDVRLNVKVHPDCTIQAVTDPRITILREHLPWHKVREWFSNLTAFLSLARGEGFGLWQLQAMASGRPLISANYSGMEEYHGNGHGYVIPHHEAPMVEGRPGLWAHFHDEDIIAILKNVYQYRDVAIAKGRVAAEVAKPFTWDASVEKLCALLKKVGALT